MASSGDLTQPLPKLVAVDLDYTLWPCWVDTHISPPLLEGSNPNELIDRAGRKFGFYADVPEILMSLRSSGVKLAACSRTHRPDIARQGLSGLQITSGKASNSSEGCTRAIDLFENLQIYPGSKLAHFRALNQDLGINFDDMLFFDDEPRNGEVEKLGVTFHLVDDRVGLDWAALHAGIESWRKKHSVSS